MRFIRYAVMGALALAVLPGCEKRSRTRNSSGSSSALFDETMAKTTNVYRFVGVEQSLTDARNAVKQEDWAAAIAACEALLEEQPGHAEAKGLLDQAKLEAPNLALYNQMTRAASAGELAAAVRAYRQIPETSLYRERGRPAFERVGGLFVEAQLADTRAHNRAGRCDDARRVARITGEWFPDARERREHAAAGGRARSSEPAVARAPDKPEKPDPEPPTPAASAPIAMAAEAPRGALSDAKPLSIPPAERALAATVPAAAVVAPPPLPAPAPVPMKPRNIPTAELEKLRIAGDKTPSLPAGAKMIARRDKVGRIVFAVKLCVSAAGVPTSVTYVKSSDYADANEKILAEIRKWRFRPYVFNGKPIPVCSATLLQYQVI